MKLLYQIDDRLKNQDEYSKALKKAAETVKNACDFAGVEYRFYDNPLEYGSRIKSNTKTPQYFADASVMIELLSTAKTGDILIYIDTDMVSTSDDSVKLLVDYIENSSKNLFLVSTVNVYNAGMFAVKVNDEIKNIYKSINWAGSAEYVNTQFGKQYLPNEIPVNDAIANNFMNITRFIDFLPNDIWNVMPGYDIGDGFTDCLPRPTENTKMLHFLSENGKTELISYFGGQK